jgi:hypothetical protein
MAERETNGKAADVVAVLKGDAFEQVFEGARPMTAMVFEVATAMEHPLEDGSKTVDHVVMSPVEIDLPLMIVGDYRSVFAQVRQLYLDKTLLTVQTRAATYSSMLIVEMPHDETAEVFDGLTVALRLKEAKIVTAEYGGLAPAKVKKPAAASTVKKGAQQPAAAKPPVKAKAETQYRGSVLSGLFRPKKPGTT